MRSGLLHILLRHGLDIGLHNCKDKDRGQPVQRVTKSPLRLGAMDGALTSHRHCKAGAPARRLSGLVAGQNSPHMLAYLSWLDLTFMSSATS